MANPQIEFDVKKNSIEIKVPLTSQGKFRCKKRNNFQEYGIGFAPKSEIIPNNAYVEWQIGYDMILGDDSKNSTLEHLTFTGANDKEKCLYELSEIMYYLCKNNIASKSEINDLIETIDNMHEFLQDSFSIKSEIVGSVIINGNDFYESVISLPTFNKVNNSCDIIIQISIEKQQYATGVQPMLYVNIPVTEFDNEKLIIGNTSVDEKYGILTINKDNFDVIKNIFICFGMCSSAHHHDILEILKIIRDNI